MANIRIKDLPADGAPKQTDLIPIDLGSTRHATVKAVVESGRPTASKTEAEAGVDASKSMTPLTTKQAIDAQVGAAYVPKTVKVNAGSGMTGGGELSGDVTVGLTVENVGRLTKVDGIEAGATKNQTDAHLLDRANHTGTQAISTVSGLQGALDNKLAIDGVADDSDKLGGETAQEWADKINVGGIYDTKAAAQAANIPSSVNAIRLNGGAALGDGNGGLYSTVNNGSTDVIVSGGRTFYCVKDVSRGRLSVGLHQAIPYATNGVSAVRALPTSDLMTRQRANTFQGEYIYNPSEKMSDNGITVLKPNDSSGDGRWVRQSGVFESIFEITFGNAGSGADFTDLTEALAFCSKYYPAYAYGRGGNGRCINLRFLSGTVLEQGICLSRGQDLGFVRLISDDPVVKVNFPTDLWWAYAEYNSRLPLFSTIFDMQGIGYDGLALKHSSSVCFEYLTALEPFSGIINSARSNVFLNTDCHGAFRKAKFTGAALDGIHFEKGCSGTAREADVRNNGGAGISMLSSCYVDAHIVDARNCKHGLHAILGSKIAAFGAKVGECSDIAIWGQSGAEISAPSSDITGAKNYGAIAENGSKILVSGSSYSLVTSTPPNGNFLARDGSEIIANNIDLSGITASASNFRVLNGSTMRAVGSIGTTNVSPQTLTPNGVVFK